MLTINNFILVFMYSPCFYHVLTSCSSIRILHYIYVPWHHLLQTQVLRIGQANKSCIRVNVTNFIQLVSLQPVDRFSQTKLRWKAPNEGYPHICRRYKNNWDIRPSVAVKALSANITWTAERICTIELALESAHQSVSNDIWCISKQ